MGNRLKNAKPDTGTVPNVARDARRPRVRLSPFLLTVLVLWGLVAGLLLFYRASQGHSHFTGVIGSGLNGWVARDSELYLDMIDQAQHGAWLFQNRFGPELSAPRYLNSVWVVIGKLSGPAGISPIAAFTAFRFISILLFVLALRRLLAETVRPPLARKLALYLVAFGGGIGWFFYVLGQRYPVLLELFLEGRKSEPTSFLPTLISPHLILSLALILWILAGFVACCREDRKAAWLTPMLVVALATFHPYDIVMIGAVGGLFTVLSWVRDRKPNLPLLRTYILSMLLSAPIIAYHAWAIRTTLDLQGLNVQNSQGPQTILTYAITVLPLAVLALRQLSVRVTDFRRATYGQLLIAAWTVALPLMIYAYPTIPFSRKLAIGMIVPFYILAAEWTDSRLRKDGAVGSHGSVNWRSRTGMVLAAAIAVSFGSSALTLAIMARTATQKASPFFLDKDDLLSMRWLARQPGADDVVVCANVHGNLIQRFAHKRALLGHMVQTADYATKESFAKLLLADGRISGEELRELRRYRARWVYVGDAEREWWNGPIQAEQLRLVHDGGSVRIYRVTYQRTEPLNGTASQALILVNH